MHLRYLITLNTLEAYAIYIYIFIYRLVLTIELGSSRFISNTIRLLIRALNRIISYLNSILNNNKKRFIDSLLGITTLK